MKKKFLSFSIVGVIVLTTIIVGGKYIKDRLNVIQTDVKPSDNFSQATTGTLETDAQGNPTVFKTDIYIPNDSTISTETNDVSNIPSYLPEELAAQRYPYQQLSETEKAIYTSLFNAVKNTETSLTFPFMVDAETYKKIYSLLYRDEAQFFYLSNAYHYSEQPTSKFNISYLYSPEQIAEMQLQIDIKIAPIMEQVNSLSSEYEKFLLIHDYIVANCEYSLDTQEVNNIYGCLINNKAGCEGYAKSINYMAKQAGLYSMLISGVTSIGEHHAWNVVRIEDEYYNIDATWDDPIISDNIISNTNSNWHFYFLIQDAGFINTTHFAETDVFIPPSCSSMKNNYYTKQNAVPTSYDNTTLIIKQQLISAIVQNKQCIEIKFNNNELYEEAIQKLFNEQKLFSILNEVNNEYGNTINSTKFSQQTSDQLLTIFIGFSYNQ